VGANRAIAKIANLAHESIRAVARPNPLLLPTPYNPFSTSWMPHKQFIGTNGFTRYQGWPHRHGFIRY